MDANEESATSELARVYWHSRRGMLELDLILMPFAVEVYAGLGTSDRDRYRSLLACEDIELYRWLVAGDPAPDSELAKMIDRVLDHARTRSKP